MIQRRQTVYLFLAAGLLVLSALVGRQAAAEAATFLSWTWLPVAGRVLGLLTALIAIAAAFLYGNRQRQKRVVGLVMILTVVIVVGLWLALFVGDQLPRLTSGEPTLILAYGGPVVAILFMWLARRRIQADIELIRSMDRLR